MTTSMAMADRIEAVRRVLEEHAAVRLAYLFGSAARGEAHRSSDLDVGIVLSPIPAPAELDQLASDLEVAAGCRVDLVVLNDAAPLLIHEAIRAGRAMVCRDDDERAEFETRATARYLDTAHLRRVQHQYLRERAEARRAHPA